MVAFNEASIVVIGYGDNNKVITQGYGERFDFGGIRLKKEIREFTLNLIQPIFKEKQAIYGIYSPLEIRKTWQINVLSNVFKQLETTFDLSAGINSTGLFEILDQI
jgi:hypothetical protein